MYIQYKQLKVIAYIQVQKLFIYFFQLAFFIMGSYVLVRYLL